MQVLQAPAKLNFGLRVLGRRPDGYHLLESLIVPLDLADRIEVKLESGSRDLSARDLVELRLRWAEDSRESSDVPSGAENLAARAAARFIDEAKLDARVRVGLEKRIPSGAGLGGGSSDAGAVLRALQKQRPDALSAEDLSRIALELGADVPFFLSPAPALVTGIGERIAPLPRFPELWILLANPGKSLATSDVFRAFAALAASLTPIQPGSTMRALRALEEAPEAISELFDTGLLVNDLEPAARRLCPPIGRLLERLRSLGARWTGMSGSGASVYGIFPDEVAARVALDAAQFESTTWARVVRCPGQGVERV